MKNWWYDMVLALGQGLKLQIKGKNTLIVLFFGLLLMLVMLLQMEEVKDEKSRIAIGIADESQSELSEKLKEEVAKLDLYEVTEGTEKELVALLKNNQLSAVCVIPEDYVASVMAGKERNLIIIYESTQSEALLVGDILAGILLQDVCLAKGYLTLEKYCETYGIETKMTFSDYKEYVNRLEQESGMEFSFETEYVSVEGETVEKPPQSLIYMQGVLAVFALMTGVIAMYAVLPFQEMVHGRIAGKLRTIPTEKEAFAIGTGISSFLIPVLFAGMFLALLSVKQKISAETTFSLLICTGAYVCVIVCIMLAAARLVSNKTVYQIGMLAMIIVFGIIGLASIVEGVLLPSGMTGWVPNSWYVRQMTELLTYKG